MATPISGLGGSGLDIPALLEQMKTAESKKLNPYLLKQSSFNGQVSSWGKISSSLDSLKSNLGKLEDEGFNGVSIGDNKAFKATAGKGAIPNSYSVIVEQLAKSHKIGTPAQASNSDQLGSNAATRTLNITIGDGKTMAVELKDDETSLTQVAKKINDKNGDVTASVMPAENGQFQLVVTSKKTGSDGEIKMEVTGDSKLADVLNYDPKVPNDPANGGNKSSAYQINAAQNAILTIDGAKVERSSNTIADAIEGITFELREVSEKDDNGDLKPETLAVTADTSKVKSLIEDFVKMYNNFLSAAGTASAYSEPVKGSSGDLAQQNPANGALFGDGTLRRLTSLMKSTAMGSYGEAGDLFQTLGSIGITVKFDGNTGDDRTGTLGSLSIDTKKLDAALKDNPKEIEGLFLGKDGNPGIKAGMEEVFKSYLGDSDKTPKTEGAIATAIKGLKEQESRVAKQITRMEQRIEDSLKRSEKEFLRLDQAMTEMNSMSQQLQAALLGIMG
ncbi:flagellar filament capping protein FliD [Pantoea sp. SOD02]|uniref:flagellar filament capping protein FliD n=1 Tax=Pantoea sp. SOD02 TaxID=2970818 RepID=UPI0021589738|nr:flagellar filament capping protein FliD [Pantoea sp. SOD02]UVC29956.1 flagellar filament capping protein FliD [Pantoea sp. SOD02]